ncbi:PIN domain-containing protein [bacterium]|nr:PIN domain-containing protein [bacterium]
MKILVDTCVWSLALRRTNDKSIELVKILKTLILEQKVQMIGPIRQELLSGIKSKKQFDNLKSYLSAFPDFPIKTQDYELAAEYLNINRKNGIQGSNTDFLICALSHNYNMPIFTIDKDFELIAKRCPILLYQAM